MNSKVLNCLIAGALGTTLALASPALARGGGGGHGGMGGGMGGHAGAMAGGIGSGMRGGGMAGATHFSAMGGSGMIGAPHFSGSRFAGSPLAAHAALSPRFSGFAFRGHRFHHRFHRFAFFGAPFAYAAYDSCWRRVWTPYGLQWVDVCYDYGY